jgi:hypothetical protein
MPSYESLHKRPLKPTPEQILEENWPRVFSSFTSFVTSSQQTLVARLQQNGWKW